MIDTAEVRIGDQAEFAVPQVVQPVIEEVEVEDVLAREASLQVGRLAAAAYADADGRLASNSFNAQVPGHAGRQLHLLEVPDHGPEGFQEMP